MRSWYKSWRGWASCEQDLCSLAGRSLAADLTSAMSAERMSTQLSVALVMQTGFLLTSSVVLPPNHTFSSSLFPTAFREKTAS